jgi:hypothetical protein
MRYDAGNHTTGHSPGNYYCLRTTNDIMGFVLYKGTSDLGKTMNLFAIRLRYSTISITGERSFGVIIMEPVEIPTSSFGYLGHMFIFVTFHGWFEP